MNHRGRIVGFFYASIFLIGMTGALAAGVSEPRYVSFQREEPRCTVHVVTVPKKERRWAVRSLHAEGQALGLEPLSAQLKRADAIRPVAAINGDYYVRQGFFAGDPRGLQITRGELISAPSGGASFWIDALDEPHVGVTVADFRIEWPDGSSAALELNTEGKEGAIVLHTPSEGSELQSRGATDLILTRNGNAPWLPLRPGRVYAAKVRAVSKGKVRVGEGEVVVSIGRKARAPKVEKDMVIKITTSTEPSLRGVAEAISGGPILLKAGKRLPIKSGKSDSYESSSMHERHPRSAIGWNEEFYFLVSVDGRRIDSVGMTLEEFGVELQKLGCRDALNLDGGGSATLWFEGKVRNYLCDGYERKVANVLAIEDKAGDGH